MRKMGEIKRPECGCDPCANDWKLKIRELWEKYQTTIRTIMMGGVEYNPDGDGRVVLPVTENVSGVALLDMSSYWTLNAFNDDIVRLTDNDTYWTMEVTS